MFIDGDFLMFLLFLLFLMFCAQCATCQEQKRTADVLERIAGSALLDAGLAPDAASQ